MTNPYRSFTFILAAFVVIFGMILSSVAYFLIADRIVQETSEVTQSAVAKPFSALPQLAGLIGGTADSLGASTGNGNKGSQAGSESDASSYRKLEEQFRTYFDIYQIQDAMIYTRDGVVVFSYNQSLMHSVVPDKKRSTFNKVRSEGSMISRRNSSLLHLWIPLKDSSGQVIGEAEVTRDWGMQRSKIWGITGTITLVTAVGMLSLFLGLRQLFLRSTRLIERQKVELNTMLGHIRHTYNESLQALSSALDSRDNETQGHSYRVTAYSWLLARQLGLKDEELETLIRGALLHDVGKIGIPDAILRKEGKLDEIEWAIMRTHVTMGVRMLEHIEFLKPALEIVKYHHERWDGKGYPAGIADCQIPLAARIFAICDSYDAMTSERPYRSALSHDEAMEELRRCAGEQFCPDGVKAFMELPEETLEKVRRLSQEEIQTVSIEDFLPRIS